MSIQFLCPGCNQPIEVDSEFGGSLVGCPYCRKTVTAPRQSTLQGGVGPMSAKPLATPAQGMPPPGAYGHTAETPSRNVVAIVAFFFSLLTVFFFAIFAVNAGRHVPELERMEQEFQTFQQRHAGKPSSDVQQEMTKWMESWPDWVWVAFGGMCAAVPCGLTALICGIIGVCRPRRRGWAVAALVLLLAGPAVLCFMPTGMLGSDGSGGSTTPQPVETPVPPVDVKNDGKAM